MAKTRTKQVYERTLEEDSAVWQKRRVFGFDILKTVILGAIGAVVVVPIVRGDPNGIAPSGYPLIIFGSLAIVLMVWWADYTR